MVGEKETAGMCYTFHELTYKVSGTGSTIQKQSLTESLPDRLFDHFLNRGTENYTHDTELAMTKRLSPHRHRHNNNINQYVSNNYCYSYSW